MTFSFESSTGSVKRMQDANLNMKQYYYEAGDVWKDDVYKSFSAYVYNCDKRTGELGSAYDEVKRSCNSIYDIDAESVRRNVNVLCRSIEGLKRIDV